MSEQNAHPNDPLHGISLRTIVEDLVARRGFEDLATEIRIRCFAHDPSVQSSLKFLRRTPWARAKVEALYLRDKRQGPPELVDKPVDKPRDTRVHRPANTRDEPADTHEPAPGSVRVSNYLDRLMRRQSFEALWPLFGYAEQPAKEMTESFSALVHLRPWLPDDGPFRVIHVGDGAHARTAALFALKTKGDNISVDPVINEALVSGWQERFAVERFAWRKATIQDVIDELNALPEMPVFVTFVHAHVNVDDVLDRLRWDAAFTLACCVPGKQLTRARTPEASGEDLCVLSPDRRFEVLVRGAGT
jgi:uncharacterized protein (DUF2132 family)